MGMYQTEGVEPYFTHPGMDQQGFTTQQLVDMLLSKIGRDGLLDQEEIRAVQALNAGLQMIASRNLGMAGPQQGGPQYVDEGTQDAGMANAGAEPVPDDSLPGTQPF